MNAKQHVGWMGLIFLISLSFSVQAETASTNPMPPEVVNLVKPGFGSQDVSLTPVLQWNAVAGAASYRVQVTNMQDFSNVLISDTVTDTMYTPPPLKNGELYFWRVRARDDTGAGPFSVRWIFATQRGGPEWVTLSSPASNETDVALDPVLSWNPVNGAASYRVQIATDVLFTSLVTDQIGVTGTSFQAPTLSVSTTYYWRVLASNAGRLNWSDAGRFTTESGLPGTVTLISPPPATANMPTNPMLTWAATNNATFYTLQVALEFPGEPFFRPQDIILTQTNFAGTNFQLTGLEHGTIYIWRVRGENALGRGPWSDTGGFITERGGPLQVIGTFPADDMAGVPINPTVFSWQPIDGASSYHLQVSNLSNFATSVVNEPALTDTTYQTIALTPETTYFWRVLASNAGIANWSETGQFTTGSPTPGAVPLVQPEDGATGLSNALTLTWNNLPNVLSYAVQIATDPGFQQVISGASGLQDTTYQVAGLAFNTAYHWRVQATNDVGAGPWSEAWTFMTLDLQPPPQPVQFAPANGATEVSTYPTFAWNPADAAESYRLEVSTSPTFSALDYTIVVNATSHVIDTSLEGLNLAQSYFWRVTAINPAGEGTSTVWSFTTVPTDVATGEEAIPEAFGLDQNYPNPFSAGTSTRIGFALAEDGPVRLSVYNVQGQAVDVPVDRVMRAGHHTLAWDPKDLPSGTYLYRLEAGSFNAIRKMTLLR